MTIDEAIIQEAETAHEKLTDYLLRRTNDEAYNTAEVNDLEKDGEYHRQLAEWLIDYKRLKEQEPQQVRTFMSSADCISRQVVHEAITRWAGSMSVLIALPTREVRPLLDSIHKLQPINPQPTGHWYIDERPESNRETICSNCEQPILKYHKLDFDYRPKFCPNCGAKMLEIPTGSKSEE